MTHYPISRKRFPFTGDSSQSSFEESSRPNADCSIPCRQGYDRTSSERNKQIQALLVIISTSGSVPYVVLVLVLMLVCF